GIIHPAMVFQKGAVLEEIIQVCRREIGFASIHGNLILIEPKLPKQRRVVNDDDLVTLLKIQKDGVGQPAEDIAIFTRLNSECLVATRKVENVAAIGTVAVVCDQPSRRVKVECLEHVAVEGV